VRDRRFKAPAGAVCIFPRSGFTLVEMLVVVAIISILISMLVPSLGRAQARARSIACLQHLRQLALGAFDYVNEMEGMLFPLATVPGAANGEWYPNLLEPYIPVSQWRYEQLGAVEWNPTEAWSCPSVDPDLVQWGGGYGVCQGDGAPGGIDGFFEYATVRQPYMTGEIRQPADKLFFADCYKPNYGPRPNCTWIGMFPPFGGGVWAGGQQQAAPRHDGEVNVAFFDGHAEPVEWDHLFLEIKNPFDFD
jgi:prepilin-type N-terminal cleavage/methylation domain-containing protein/prepilin-type processing-associated H-X9-DG protein